MADTTTNNLASGWSDALLDVLERQRELVDELSSLAVQQAGLIDDQRTDALLALLTRRQHLIDEFTGAQETLSGLTGDLDRRVDELEPERRDRIRSLIAHVGDRLAVVMEGDARDQRRLESSRSAVARESAATQTARVARAAYRGSGAVDNRFADQKG